MAKNEVIKVIKTGDTIQLIEKVEELQLEMYGYYRVFDVMFGGRFVLLIITSFLLYIKVF
ncbi:hypothetical protein X559_0720 [Paenilisteria newyorkensis]|nr:hypothetical protein X559_0720 [Listeria newyorkensis]